MYVIKYSWGILSLVNKQMNRGKFESADLAMGRGRCKVVKYVNFSRSTAKYDMTSYSRVEATEML